MKMSKEITIQCNFLILNIVLFLQLTISQIKILIRKSPRVKLNEENT